MDKKRRDIAKALGANLFVELFGDNIVFHFFGGDGKIIDTKIILAVKGPGNNLREFGVAYGADIYHCLCLGNELCRDFVRRVFAFKAVPNEGGCGISVTFYCRK